MIQAVHVRMDSGGPVWLSITNIGVLADDPNPHIVATNIGHARVPQATETFTHDWDGNLTSDSLWTNVWNGENRRTLIESRPNLPVAAKARVQWTHLPDGRWIERIVSTNNGSGYFPAQTNRYVWDGNVLLAVLNHTNGLQLSFLRGLDLSGTMQGAGGVGGLLAVQVGPAGPAELADTTHFAAYDGNGNIVALSDASNGSETARYEYGPFAEPLRMTGPMARVNPIRFSTQYADDVTGDLKYLYRDYRADWGRWANRDPIGEPGGLNLHGFVENDSVNRFDLLGREVVGKAYQESGLIGHAAMDVYGASYGFGPKNRNVPPHQLLNTVGTTSGYSSTTIPRTEWNLRVKRSGTFKDKLGGKCCDATRERIIQCADHFKVTWNNTSYRALTRNCRHYVDEIVSSCCLRRGFARMNWGEGRTE
jgi:RHS repeat-associated protein